MASFLDACEFEDYINEAGWWATQREPLLIVSKTADGVTSVADAAQADPVAHEGHIEVNKASTAVFEMTLQQRKAVPLWTYYTTYISGPLDICIDTATVLNLHPEVCNMTRILTLRLSRTACACACACASRLDTRCYYVDQPTNQPTNPYDAPPLLFGHSDHRRRRSRCNQSFSAVRFY